MAQLSLEDRAEIHDLYMLYPHAFDGGDADAWVGLFAKDARFTVPGAPTIVGPDAMREFITTRNASTPGMRHLMANVLIESDGRGVTGRAYFLAVRLAEDGSFRLRNIGRYEDEFIREDGSWKFSARTVISELAPDLIDAQFAFAALAGVG